MVQVKEEAAIAELLSAGAEFVECLHQGARKGAASAHCEEGRRYVRPGLLCHVFCFHCVPFVIAR